MHHPTLSTTTRRDGPSGESTNWFSLKDKVDANHTVTAEDKHLEKDKDFTTTNCNNDDDDQDILSYSSSTATVKVSNKSKIVVKGKSTTVEQSKTIDKMAIAGNRVEYVYEQWSTPIFELFAKLQLHAEEESMNRFLEQMKQVSTVSEFRHRSRSQNFSLELDTQQSLRLSLSQLFKWKIRLRWNDKQRWEALVTTLKEKISVLPISIEPEGVGYMRMLYTGCQTMWYNTLKMRGRSTNIPPIGEAGSSQGTLARLHVAEDAIVEGDLPNLPDDVLHNIHGHAGGHVEVQQVNSAEMSDKSSLTSSSENNGRRTAWNL